jgi:hypothetical protein
MQDKVNKLDDLNKVFSQLSGERQNKLLKTANELLNIQRSAASIDPAPEWQKRGIPFLFGRK